jgi:hypothetical protein
METIVFQQGLSSLKILKVSQIFQKLRNLIVYQGKTVTMLKEVSSANAFFFLFLGGLQN